MSVKSDNIDTPTCKQGKLYSKPETKLEIKEINNELCELRKDVRTCNNIFEDAEHIRKHTNYVSRLEQEAKNTSKIKHKTIMEK